jgi:hypothetical protein
MLSINMYNCKSCIKSKEKIRSTLFTICEQQPREQEQQ